MNPSTRLIFTLILLVMLLFHGCNWLNGGFESRWEEVPHRVWIGADYWANRLQDWRIHEGRLECVDNTRPLRTVHVLTRHLNRKDGSFFMSLQTGTLSESARRTDAWAGFLLGAGSLQDDYRMRSLIHQAHGRQGGLVAGINGKGEVVVVDNQDSRNPLSLQRDRQFHPSGIPESGANLYLLAIPSGNAYRLTLWARNHITGETIDSAYIGGIRQKRLQGNLALAAHIEDTSHKASFWFKKWKMEGTKIRNRDDRQFGPVLGAHYTVSQNTLRMTAQMPPLSKDHLKQVKLEIRKKGTNEWQEASQSAISNPGWMASFSLRDWNSHKTWEYRLSYPLEEYAKPHYLKGIIRKEPDQENLVLAGISNMKSMREPIGKNYHFTGDSIGFPHQTTLSNILKHQPDILAYTGNQVHKNLPTTVKYDSTDEVYLDYLYKWYMFCWANGALTQNIPTIILPGHSDLYRKPLHVADTQKTGQTARISRQMPASFINMVQKSQTGHLPAPYNPAPNPQGIPAFYTDLQYAGLDLAILEAYKFTDEHPTHATRPQAIPSDTSSPLGHRQLHFLREWSYKWTGAHIKAVLSPKPAAGPEWKQALEIIRKAHAIMITSGRTMAYAIHQGIERIGDAGYEFGIPPLSDLNYNSSSDSLPVPDGMVQTPGKGYGIIHFDINQHQIKLSAWPAEADPSADKPLTGWPVTLEVEDNYRQNPVGYLPEIITKGLNHRPVYKVYHDNDPELIYAKRAKNKLFRPAVYDESVYTLVVGSPEENRMDTLRNLVPVKLKKQIILDFRQR